MFRRAALFLLPSFYAFTFGIASAWGGGQVVADGSIVTPQDRPPVPVGVSTQAGPIENSVTPRGPVPPFIRGRHMDPWPMADKNSYGNVDPAILRGIFIVASVLGVSAALAVLLMKRPGTIPPAA